jgi:hypothetical protein
MNQRYLNASLITAAAAILLAITMGSRSSFGLFVSPLNSATGLGLAAISLQPVASSCGAPRNRSWACSPTGMARRA